MLYNITRILSVALLFTALILLFVNPKAEDNLPNGFITPIIAFEFIQNKQEIINFFSVKNVETYQSSMLLGNAIDYLFMCLYSGLLFCIAIIIKREKKWKWMNLAFIFCITMCLADALENYQIYQLITKLKYTPELVQSINSYNYYDIHITLLKFFTWIKWSAIATTFLLFSFYFLQQQKWLNKLTGFASISSYIFCWLAFFKHGMLNEVFSTNIVLVFLLLCVFVFTHSEKIKAIS